MPDDLADEDGQMLYLDLDEEEAFQRAKRFLADDLRFEHLVQRVGDPLDRQLWRFVCRSALRPADDHVPEFVDENAKEPEERVCFFPVEWLNVQKPVDLVGVRFLPPSSDEVPPEEPFFSLGSPVGSVLPVPVEGTNLTLMKERAEPVADRALKLLRLMLRQKVPNMQLRFQLSEGYSFGTRQAGWQLSPDAGVDLTLHQDLIDFSRDHVLASLAGPPVTNLQQKAHRALGWLSDAELAIDPTVALLFRFFALEALLGKKGEQMKGEGLAFRRAMLSVATRGSFTDPFRAYRLYAEVRSAAVHGDDPPEEDPAELQRFAEDANQALIDYVELATNEGFETRRRVLKFLDAHPRRQRLIDWLLQQPNQNAWRVYFEKERMLADGPV